MTAAPGRRPGLLEGVQQASRLFLSVAREEGLGAALHRSVRVLRHGASQRWWQFRAWLTPANTSPLTIPAVAPPGSTPAHQASVDIVVCVHNAPTDVRDCLASVSRHTCLPYRLILVDDGSDPETRDYLADFAQTQGADLLRNEVALGYTYAANQGLRHSRADYVVLLNSDTIVTAGWLDRLIACAESDPRLGLVGPLSNTASWQSIPDLVDADGDWADNPLPDLAAIDAMARAVGLASARTYPRLPFLNGFCLAIRRSVIDSIGYFDEATFGRGYGEENDYCLRARQAGWLLAVADDTYIYHAQSRSYSHERRRELSQKAHQALVVKHGAGPVEAGVQVCHTDRVMLGVRARARVLAERNALAEAGRARWEGQRVLFVLPVGGEPGGGGNVVFQEAVAMQRMGVDVRLVNLASNRLLFGANALEPHLPVVYVDHARQISDVMEGYDAVVATLYASVAWIEGREIAGRRPVRGYYVQDFEPYFFAPGTPGYQEAWASYTRYPDLVRFTKTEWNREQMKQHIGVDCAVVGPSVNIDLFRPRLRRDVDWPRRPLRVAAMIRPSSPRRGPRLTMELLRQLHGRLGGGVEIILFGCAPHDPAFRQLPHNFPWRAAGILQPAQLASLFNDVDVFVDFSAFQAMGLTALEAMACGAAVIVPQAGGAHSFARPGQNCLMVDTASRAAGWEALERLATDAALRGALQREAIASTAAFFPERAAYNILAALFPAG